MAESQKTRVWKGRQQAYLQNPNTGKYGWYNIEEKYMTDYGRDVQASITSLDEDYNYITSPYDFDSKWDADTKEARLRRNIMYVLDTKIGNQRSLINDVDILHDMIRARLTEMSDFEIIFYSRENKDNLQLFFEYETYLNSSDYGELDAQTLKLLEGLGINAEDFMNVYSVPPEVVDKLMNLNDRLDLKKEVFDDD